MSQARDEGGKFIEKIGVDQVLELLTDANEPLTATEIADQLGVSSRTVLNKLYELHESNPTVKRKEIGANGVIWFIKHGAIHEKAFEAFAERLTDEVGELIEEIILYGSVARGEAREDSDVDVLIVIEDESVRERVREQASELSFETMLEYGVMVSEMLETQAAMERGDSSLLRTVQNEGIAYA